jgi:hypothetical protein
MIYFPLSLNTTKYQYIRENIVLALDFEVAAWYQYIDIMLGGIKTCVIYFTLYVIYFTLYVIYLAGVGAREHAGPRDNHRAAAAAAPPHPRHAALPEAAC